MSGFDVFQQRLLTVSVAVLAACGCGAAPEGDTDRPATVPITGVVTYNEQPVEGATVTFTPNVPVSSRGSARGAVGVTDASGRYELMTFAPGDGAVPGEYLVTIVKYEGRPPAENVSEDDYEPPDENEEIPLVPKHLLPEQYSKTNTSGFTATVESGSGTFDFALTD